MSIRTLLSLLPLALLALVAGDSPPYLVIPARDVWRNNHLSPTVQTNETLPAVSITAAASVERPVFNNKTGCSVSESPRVNKAARDAAWTLLGQAVQQCCDDLDCDTPGTPQHPGDCDKLIKCGAPCPAEPVDGLTPAMLNPLGSFDTCKKRAPPGQLCVCSCHCVCKYASGRIHWCVLSPTTPPERGIVNAPVQLPYYPALFFFF